MEFSAAMVALMVTAGIAAGFVGYAVGVTSLVSYPAMLALGIPPVLANTSNTVGVIGTGIGGVLGARRELRGQVARCVVYVVMGAVGGVLGAMLLLSLDPQVFEFAVPPLILFSTMVIAVNPRGRAETRQAVADAQERLRGGGDDGGGATGDGGAAHACDSCDSCDGGDGRIGDGARAVQGSPSAWGRPMSRDPWWVWLGMAGVAVYSGYFGAGAGTVSVAVLDAGKVGPFHGINALKTCVGFGANITASVIFIVRGTVDWPAAIAMGIGCFLGALAAPSLTRGIPARILRGATVCAGLLLALSLALRTYW